MKASTLHSAGSDSWLCELPRDDNEREASVAQIYDFIQIQKAKEKFFSGAEIPTGLDAELLNSWKRSKESIGAIDRISAVSYGEEDQLDESLVDIFRAPINKFAETIEDTGLAVLLADPDGRILNRWCSDHSILRVLDRIGTVRTAILSEDTVGTNGVGTVLKTGKSVLVRGSEHVADFYGGSDCAGAPVWHPITGKLLAVVTLTSAVSQRSSLLVPLLKSLTYQLEGHVLNMSDLKTRSTLSSFLNIRSTSTGPVIAFGPHDMHVQNDSADRLSVADVQLIRRAAQDGRGDGSYPIQLSIGEAVLRLDEVDKGYPLATIIERERIHASGSKSLEPESKEKLIGRSSEWLSALSQIANHRQSASRVIVAGEIGVGKLSAALGYPAKAGANKYPFVIDSAEMHMLGLSEWLHRVSMSLDSHHRLIIQEIGSLTPQGLDGLASILENSHHNGSVILTQSANHQAEIDQIRIKFGVNSVWVPPLRERIGDIPALWRAFSESESNASNLRLTDDAIEVLRAYGWPGNVKELRTIVTGLLLEGKRGTISAEDLPQSLRRPKNSSLIDRVEADAIRRALEEAHGNRRKAAEILGLSRATVYRKMKSYRIA